MDNNGSECKKLTQGENIGMFFFLLELNSSRPTDKFPYCFGCLWVLVITDNQRTVNMDPWRCLFINLCIDLFKCFHMATKQTCHVSWAKMYKYIYHNISFITILCLHKSWNWKRTISAFENGKIEDLSTKKKVSLLIHIKSWFVFLPEL